MPDHTRRLIRHARKTFPRLWPEVILPHPPPALPFHYLPLPLPLPLPHSLTSFISPSLPSPSRPLSRSRSRSSSISGGMIRNHRRVSVASLPACDSFPREARDNMRTRV